MLTVHEDERQRELGLHAAYHGFVAMYLVGAMAAVAGFFVLRDEGAGFAGMAVVLAGVVVHQVTMWRGGRAGYVREMVNRTDTTRSRARRQLLLFLGALLVYLSVFGYARDGRPLGHSLLTAFAGVAVAGALYWLLYLRRPGPGE